MMAMQTRRLSLAPSTFDKAAGTVQATISTGAAVQRSGYVEQLAVTRDAVEVAPHLPVLDAHRQGSIADVLGRVTDVAFTNGSMAATLRISSSAALDAIERGDLSGVSIGYRVGTWTEARAGGVLTRTAAKWRLMEVSLVPLPADAGAVLRSEIMTETTSVETTTEQTTTVERAELNRSIRTVATATQLGTVWADGQIDAGATVEQARAAALDELIKRGGGTIRNQRVEPGTSNDDPSVLVTRMTEALTARVAPTAVKPSDAAVPFMNLSIVDMARHLLTARGERVATASREEVIKRAMHTTSDFPSLLNATGNRVLAQAYQAAPNALKALARQTTLPDFRAKSTLRLGDFGPLLPVNEHGEIKATTRAETSESYSLATFARLFSLSRQALINDDLHAFADWNIAMGRAAAETEAAQLVNLLIANPAMSDGKALFSTSHGTLATAGSAPEVNGLSAGRMAMRTQKGLDGKTPISATPKFMLVPPALETLAEALLSSIFSASGTSNYSVFPNLPQTVSLTSGLTLMVEPRLLGNAWYLFADPAIMPVLEYAYLSSAPGPQLATREGWDVLGIEFRAVLDFGAGAVDFRGAYKNPGAA